MLLFLIAACPYSIGARGRFHIQSDGLRLVHGESDGLPGLIVDRYGDTLVAQFTSAGVEKWKQVIADALLAATGLTKLYERSDASSRALEGFPEATGWLRGSTGTLAANLSRVLKCQRRSSAVHRALWHAAELAKRVAAPAAPQPASRADHTGVPPQAAPFICQPCAAKQQRSSRCARAAGPRQHHHHTGLHTVGFSAHGQGL